MRSKRSRRTKPPSRLSAPISRRWREFRFVQATFRAQSSSSIGLSPMLVRQQTWTLKRRGSSAPVNSATKDSAPPRVSESISQRTRSGPCSAKRDVGAAIQPFPPLGIPEADSANRCETYLIPGFLRDRLSERNAQRIREPHETLCSPQGRFALTLPPNRPFPGGSRGS